MQQNGGQLQQNRMTTPRPVFPPEHTPIVNGIIHIPLKYGA
jgi:hypothetical protein